MMPEQITTLTQKALFRGSQRFEILSDGNLQYASRQLLYQRQSKIPLWQIVPEPERIKFYPAGTIAATLIFGVALLAILGAMLMAHDRGMVIVWLFPLFIVGTIFAAALWKMQDGSVNCMAFSFRGGGQLHVWFGRPDQRSFDSFCELLQKKAADAWQNRPTGVDASLPGQLRELHRLREEGILSAAEHEKAKSKLLEQSADRRIGYS
jgi:hypothetical protein